MFTEVEKKVMNEKVYLVVLLKKKMFLLAQQGLLVQWITGHVETVFTYLSLH